MKFRTKLHLVLLALTFGTTLFGLNAVYLKVHKLLFEELRSKVLTVAATGAMSINGDLLAKIYEQSGVHSIEYDKVSHELQEIRDANRRKDMYILYVYTIRPNPIDPNKIIVGAVAHTETENLPLDAYPNQPYPEGSEIGILDHLQTAWAPDHIVADRWDTFLPGYAPIFDSHGRYVGTLGINLSTDYIDSQLNQLKVIISITLAVTLTIGFIASTLLAHTVHAALEKIGKAVRCITHGAFDTRIPVHGSDEFNQFATAINDMAAGLEERERLKLIFTRYSSKNILEKILSSDTTPSLHGERRKVTVLFSDIREFTHLAEKLPPEDVVSLLNEYFAKMIEIIFRNNGTLDKFLGDGLMVEFGTPLDDEAQEMHAVKTAVEMQQALKVLNQKWQKEGRACLKIGIGIHTGQAIVGNIGSEERMEYTAIGDTVNIASRLENMSKTLKVGILISEETNRSLDKTYKKHSFGQVTITGRDAPIEVFSIEV